MSFAGVNVCGLVLQGQREARAVAFQSPPPTLGKGIGFHFGLCRQAPTEPEALWETQGSQMWI